MAHTLQHQPEIREVAVVQELQRIGIAEPGEHLGRDVDGEVDAVILLRHEQLFPCTRGLQRDAEGLDHRRVHGEEIRHPVFSRQVVGLLQQTLQFLQQLHQCAARLADPANVCTPSSFSLRSARALPVRIHSSYNLSTSDGV